MNDIELALFTIGDLELTRRRLVQRLQELEAQLAEPDLTVSEPE